ncbi:MAG: 30S ribosomal protein S9 [Chthoniobacterales bacterium]
MATTQEITATGRRKTSVARLWIKKGTGQILVNGKEFTEYFPTLSLQNIILRPFEITNSANAYDVKVKTNGGGTSGQAGAMRLAIARALIEFDAESRPALKKEGMLTRDPRMKERKKPGQPGARKRFQFSKR